MRILSALCAVLMLPSAASAEWLEASSTHASLLRPILDYSLRAAGPRGRVTVVDTPVEGCELAKVIGRDGGAWAAMASASLATYSTR